MLIYTATTPTPNSAPARSPLAKPPQRSRMSYRYAFPDWFDEHHRRIIIALDTYHHLDTNQLIRLTGYHERRVQRLCQLLEQAHYIKAFERAIWRTNDRRRSSVWGLLPRGALVRSLDTKTPLIAYRTFENHPPSRPVAEHAIDLADIRITCEQSAAEAGLKIANWKDEGEWRKGAPISVAEFDAGRATSKTLQFRPDGSFTTIDQAGHTSYFFVEADRTDNREDWQHKARCYKALWSSGQFHRHFNVADVDTGFRVLVTAITGHRVAWIKAIIESIGSPDLACLFLIAPIKAVAEAGTVFTQTLWLRGGSQTTQAICASQGSPSDYPEDIAGKTYLQSLTQTAVSPFTDCFPVPTHQLSFGL